MVVFARSVQDYCLLLSLYIKINANYPFEVSLLLLNKGGCLSACTRKMERLVVSHSFIGFFFHLVVQFTWLCRHYLCLLILFTTFRYMLIKEVGDGTFGSVWRAINKQTGEVVSICSYHSAYIEKKCLKNDYFQFYNLLLINRLQLKKWRKSITHGRSVSIWEKWRWCIPNFLFRFRLPYLFSLFWSQFAFFMIQM